MPDPAAHDPHTPVFDQKGTLWFTVQEGNFVGRLDPQTGVIKLKPSPTPNSVPYGIAVTSKGIPFFCEFGTNKLATINPNTVIAQTVRDVGFNQVFYFAIGGGTATPRRKVVSQATCTGCHSQLLLHGGIRQNVEYCVVCHSPTVTDSGMRAAKDTPESINLKTMIHKIHTGSDLTTDFTVMGHGNSVNNYNDVGYVGDRRNCEACHLPGTYDLPLPDGLISQVAPRDYLNPMPPVSGACLSCHTTKPAAAHAAVMTSPTLGESCDACHGPNADASVAKVHAR